MNIGIFSSLSDASSIQVKSQTLVRLLLPVGEKKSYHSQD